MHKLNHTFIIAEAGVNHNGSLQTAYQLIDAAKKAGSNAIKFQTFTAEKMVTRNAPKAAYQKKTTEGTESQFEMIKKLELSKPDHIKLNAYCHAKKILFLSSPFHIEAISFLHKMGMGIFKVPSGEITNLPYLRCLGKLNKKVILSTGMANLGEVEYALNVLQTCGTSKSNISVLHCNTDYPTAYGAVNLRAMLTIQNAFRVTVGYSDHTLGIEIPIAAVALGAQVIEKHFTLDRNMEGPDHKASLEPDELAQMVKAIRHVEQALGDGIKKRSASEEKNMAIVRKSIVAARNIQKGELFSEANIMVKRPGNGISPLQWDRIIGRQASRNFKEDELIEW